jgi:hypothetical protein
MLNFKIVMFPVNPIYSSFPSGFYLSLYFSPGEEGLNHLILFSFFSSPRE